MNLEDELKLHFLHSQKQLQRDLTELEMQALRTKIRERGMQKPDEALLKEIARVAGLKESATLLEVARSFRKRKNAKASDG